MLYVCYIFNVIELSHRAAEKQLDSPAGRVPCLCINSNIYI